MANKRGYKRVTTVRKGIQLSESIAKWYEEKADEIGVSQSGLMVMALVQFKDNQDTIQATKELPKWLSKAQELQSTERENRIKDLKV